MCFQKKISPFSYPDIGFILSKNLYDNPFMYSVIKYPSMIFSAVADIFLSIGKMFLYPPLFVFNRVIQLINFNINEIPERKKLLVDPLYPSPEKFASYFNKFNDPLPQVGRNQEQNRAPDQVRTPRSISWKRSVKGLALLMVATVSSYLFYRNVIENRTPENS